MKLYPHRYKYKKYALAHAKRSHRQQLHFNKVQKDNRRSEQGIARWWLKELNKHKVKHYKFAEIWAPSVFSFIDNPEEVSQFVAELERCYLRRAPVFIMLLGVERMDYGAVAVLLSVMVRFRSAGIRFNGNFPRDNDAKIVITDSMFFEHLYKKYSEDDMYKLDSSSSIHTHAMRQVDSELGARIIQEAATTVWGEPCRCPGVQRALIELMHNTNNHASLTHPGEKHWWLSVKHHKDRHQVEFSFVDYGVGVFRSLEGKPEDNLLRSAYKTLCQRISDMIHPDRNAEMLRLIFEGELHKTATGEPYRGYGLPGIYRSFKSGNFSDFVMITNNIIYDSRTNLYRVLNRPFSGTFVSWTLNQNNRKLANADTD